MHVAHPRRTVDEQGRLRCSQCRRRKDQSFFGRHSVTGRISGRCRPCIKKNSYAYYHSADGAAKAKAWRERNKERSKEISRRHQLKRDYGISVEFWEGLYAKQKRRCALCLRRPGKKRLAVDHCHRSERVRGLLCGSCNTGLGLFQDDPVLLRKAIRYLRRHR